MDWMTDKQKQEFEEVCCFIDSIKSPKDFYRIINFINDNYSIDVVNCAREQKRCFNSAQYA